jgi:hypothetical protein
MSITHSRVFQQLLIQGDGQGGFQAAHVEWLDRLVMPDGRAIYSPQPLQAVACSAEEEGCPISEVLDAATLAAVAEVDRARGAETEALSQAEAAREALANALDQLRIVSIDLTEVSTERDGLLLALAEEAQRSEALRAELEQARERLGDQSSTLETDPSQSEEATP